MSFKHLIINNEYGLAGTPPLLNRDIFGLKVNDVVTQIGEYNKNGNETSSCSVWKLKKPLRYKGIFIHFEEGIAQECMCFELLEHEANIEELNNLGLKEDTLLYFLFWINDNEIMQFDAKNGYPTIYHAKFIKQ